MSEIIIEADGGAEENNEETAKSKWERWIEGKREEKKRRNGEKE